MMDDGPLARALREVVEGRALGPDDARAAFEAIIDGHASPARLAGFLIALRMRGETVGELAAFAGVLRDRATPIRSEHPVIVDTCGTGGDGAGTFNISTIAAFVVAAAGVPVAKHGNRSVSSRCGSADLLEGLGIRVDASRETIERSLREVGIGFLFAPALHGGVGHASEVRRDLGVRTVFNLLGPLTNPARASRQLLGVYDPNWVEPLARVLGELGCKKALVVHGGGLDEIALHAETQAAELSDGRIRTFTLRPEEAGLRSAPLREISGGDVTENVAIAEELLAGAAGPRRDVVLLNAAAALLIAGRVSSLRQGIAHGAQALDSGAARRVVERLRAVSPAGGTGG